MFEREASVWWKLEALDWFKNNGLVTYLFKHDEAVRLTHLWSGVKNNCYSWCLSLLNSNEEAQHSNQLEPNIITNSQ